MRVFLVTILVICLEFLCYKGVAQSTQCKENEEFQECASGCPLTCQNYREPLFCTVQCKRGCFCRPGYVKGPDDKCIRPTQCPIGPCKDGEVPSTCVNPCNNCIQKGKCYFEYCIKGCDCRPGYYRNSSDICVIADKCGSETHLCPPNEHYKQCINPCNDCWTKGHCSESYCQPGCDCNPGYFRDDYGTCVLEAHCENHDAGCGANEFFTDCVNTCNDCEHKGHCDIYDHFDCHYGCDCKRGFFRNHDGHCIPESECAAIMCGHFEEFSECGSACPITCDSYNKQIPCTLHCVKGCFCIQGYIRGPAGKCIRPRECPKVCGENEEYSDCGSSCPLHCSNITTPSSSICPNTCNKGCFCKPGYVRGSNGRCILQSACPPICGEYEEFRECGTGCIATCENRVHIGDCTKPCTKGCFCVSGYIRGPGGKCILPESCPPVCGRNEEYRECGSACPANCTNQNPVCREVCIRGCFCLPGYVRDPYGICVLPSTCPLICQENEIFMSCGPRCEPSCDAIHRNPALCPGCQRGCFCKPGYVRGPDRKCILPTSCPAVCEENEEFSHCASSCPPTCMDRNPTCTSNCNRGCVCKVGYVRDSTGKCILATECPLVCPDHETFRLCGTSCPITCSNIGKSVSCKLHCTRGCFCNDGYVRGPNGTCITPELCPIRCGQHEVLKECGTACQPTCANYTNHEPCAAPCVKGCFCRRGYVRNTRGKCILKKHCPARCKNNEVLTCSSHLCEGSCDDDADDHHCIGDCTNGCYCRRGFVRAPDGNCVPRSLCPRVVGFDGRKGGNAEENDTASSSSNPMEASSPLTTRTNLDQSTKLDEPIPSLEVSIPLVGELLDEAVSSPASFEVSSLQTGLSSITAAKETSQMATTPKSSENPTMAITINSPVKPTENPIAAVTMKLSSKSLDIPMTTKLPIKSSQNPILEMEPMDAQTLASKPTDSESSKANATELESSTSPLNMDDKTSNNPVSTLSTMKGTTV